MDTNGRDEVITAKSSLHHAEVRYCNHYMDTNGKGEVITTKSWLHHTEESQQRWVHIAD
jgi:hypothetical protein